MTVFFFCFNNLELEQVGLVTGLQGEVGGKVLLEKRSLLDLGDKSSVNILLVADSLGLELLLLALGKELLLGLLVGVRSSKVGGGELVGLDALDRDSGRGGNDVSGVDSSERDTVDLEGAGHKESAVLERLEENNSLASESAGEENEDSSRDERGSHLLGVLLLGNLGGGALGDIPLGGLLGRDVSVTAVLGSSDLLGAHFVCSVVGW